VRGLDYYTHTVFEIVSRELGAQDALVGGGRYDELVSDLGGPRVPGIGFAIGEDRLVDLLPETSPARFTRRVPVAIVPDGAGAMGEALEVAEQLRNAGVPVEVDSPRRALGKSIERAAKRGARRLVLIFENEATRGQTTLRDLTSGEQTVMSREALVEELLKELGTPGLDR
jgi:histidyl-tRNA synthetase